MPGGTLRVAKTTIGGNLENGGTVQMNSEGGKPGNVLTVNGNYTGNNGLMTFNATLGGDNSPTDKMNVKGDTQGNTRVRVDNIGGVGAQTVNGIELIEVGGNSAGNFALTTGTVEAGAYVYTLAKGKGNDEKNWYLTSKWDGVTPPDTPDPINNPPVVDPEGPSVYRPEAGSYISNIAAANSLFSHRLHDRLGEPQYIDSLHSQGSASSMWMRHVGGHERSRAGDGQLNTQANRYVLQLGGDLAQWSSNAQDRWHLGVMAGYANSEALRDRYDFIKFQVFQWLIGATDGHAKNFSVFIQAGGSYRLTPFYDIISAFPVLGGTGIHISDLKLAMGLNASKGKKTAIDKIYPRHFLATAKVLRFPEVQMHEILSDFARMIPAALDNVKTSLPTDFPENVVTAVETNVLRLHGRLSREYGSK
ncbi:autotransporter outer membrane beta-barrel domain-containing protein [Escherichia coli]